MDEHGRELAAIPTEPGWYWLVRMDGEEPEPVHVKEGPDGDLWFDEGSWAVDEAPPSRWCGPITRPDRHRDRYIRTTIAFNRLTSMLAQVYGEEGLPEAPEFVARVHGYAMEIALGLREWQRPEKGDNTPEEAEIIAIGAPASEPSERLREALQEALVFLGTVGASTPNDHPWVEEARRLANKLMTRLSTPTPEPEEASDG